MDYFIYLLPLFQRSSAVRNAELRSDDHIPPEGALRWLTKLEGCGPVECGDNATYEVVGHCRCHSVGRGEFRSWCFGLKSLFVGVLHMSAVYYYFSKARQSTASGSD